MGEALVALDIWGWWVSLADEEGEGVGGMYRFVVKPVGAHGGWMLVDNRMVGKTTYSEEGGLVSQWVGLELCGGVVVGIVSTKHLGGGIPTLRHRAFRHFRIGSSTALRYACQRVLVKLTPLLLRITP